MIVLIDLDGTLTNTAHPNFKDVKDGKLEPDVNSIPVLPGAKEFIKHQKEIGNRVIIVSDSHPRYVKPIAQMIFGLEYVCLTDKPNIKKTEEYIFKNADLSQLYANKDNFILIGDSWLDIELGRRLNIKTVLTKFYNATHHEQRDGIGDDWKPIKAGPTYYTNTFNRLNEIINDPMGSLLAIEAIFQGRDSSEMVRFKYRKYSNGFTAFRCLARQEDGESDRYSRTDMYKQIDNPERSEKFISTLADGVSNYLDRVSNFPEYEWDILTYVSDKKTTSPPNKMKEIFDRIETSFNKLKVFEWDDNVQGSLRHQKDYKSRREFIGKHIHISENIDLKDKSIIVIDDQFTTSATAYEISNQLRSAGVKNILFIALFYLTLPVNSKTCSRCGKPMSIKIRKKDGNKFYSCTPPQFRGEGCGHIENI